MANDINLPNLVSHLNVDLSGVSGAVADASRQGSAMGAALGRGVNRELDALLRNLPQVTIDGNSDAVDRDLARIHRELAQLDSQRIGVDVSMPDALRQLEQLHANLQRIGDEHPNVNVQASTRQAARQLEELLAAARRVDGQDVTVNVNVDEDRVGRLSGVLGRLSGAARGLGGIAAPFARVSATIGAVVPAVASVVSSLAQVAPAAGVAVTGMMAVQLASGTVKLAAVGMDDALSAALDPAKADQFSKSLEKLSPNARAFAKEVHSLGPSLRSMQQAVQNKVFSGFGGQLDRTAKSVLPVLRTNLLSSAGALNDMGKGVFTAARQLADNGTLGKALGSASKGLHNLSGIPKVVVTSLGQIGAAAGPSFERLTKGAGKAASKIGDRLSKAFKSGAMEKAIDRAIDLIGRLADVAGNVLKIVGSVFSAAETSGGGFIGTLQTITGALADAFAKPEVQDGLKALFETMSTLATTAAPLLVQVLGLIAPILVELGPPLQDLITALGETLGPIIEELGPVLVELAGFFGQLIIAALPLLDLVGDLITVLLPVLTPLLQTLSDVLDVLTPIISTVAQGLDLILTPALSGLAEFLTDVVFPAIKIVTDILKGDFSSASQTARDMVQKMIDSQVQAFSTFPGRVKHFILTFVSETIASFGRAKDGAVKKIVSMADDAVNYVRTLPQRVQGALAGMHGVLVSAGKDLIQGFIDGITSRIPSVRGVLSGLTGQLTNWKGPPKKDARILTPAGRLLIKGFIDGINGSTASLRAKLGQITRALPANVKSGYGKTLAKSTAYLNRLVTVRDGVIKRLAAAQKKLDGLLKERSKAASDITSGILKEADITSGHSDVNSVSAITVGLQQALKKTKEFQANIAKLKKSGLRSDLLQQIADAGVDGGAATAAALSKATPAELKKINDLQAQLAKSATATGNTVGDALYSAGIRAAEGLVNGLKSQEKAIEKQMRKIAEQMLTTVKKKHKTHSPSRAFHDIGVMDGEGLRGGLLASTTRVRDAARSMAGAALDIASSAMSPLAMAAPSAQQLAAVYAGTGSGGDTYHTWNLNGGDATPGGILRALSWRGLVGGR